MSHAAYVYDIEHVIVDNLQFMTSYLRYVLTHNAFYFRSFFFFLSLLQAPRWDAQRFWKVQCKKRLGAVERGSVGAYWSSSWYTFSLEASLPTTIVWTDRLSSAKWPTRNACVILVNPRCLSPSFPAAVAPSSQITCVLFLLNLVFATALPSQNLKQASLFLGLEFALNVKF